MTSVAHARPHAQGEGDAHHAPMSFWRKYIFSTDHKIIGIQFLFVSLFFLLVGGLLAMQIRWQLGFPGKPSCQRRSEEHTSELQSLAYLVCRLLLEKKKKNI